MLDFFFFKQKTAYEMRISDWSSDVCSSDLSATRFPRQAGRSNERVVTCEDTEMLTSPAPPANRMWKPRGESTNGERTSFPSSGRMQGVVAKPLARTSLTLRWQRWKRKLCVCSRVQPAASIDRKSTRLNSSH